LPDLRLARSITARATGFDLKKLLDYGFEPAVFPAGSQQTG